MHNFESLNAARSANHVCALRRHVPSLHAPLCTRARHFQPCQRTLVRPTPLPPIGWPIRPGVAPRARAQGSSAGQSPTASPPPPGLCGLPGVSSPAALRQYWRFVARPRLDALLRAAAREPPGPAFLGLLDRLVSELRNVVAPACHVAAHHVDPEWREAAEAVAADAGKYETFLFQTADSELLPRLHLTAQRLAAQRRRRREEPRQARAARQDAAGSDAGAEAFPGTVAAPQAGAGIEAAGAGVEAQAEAKAGAEAELEYERQLRLCGLLRRSLLRGGAGLEDEGGLAGLYALRTAPSSAQQRLSGLLAAERRAVAAVAAAVAAGPGRLALPPEHLAAALREADGAAAAAATAAAAVATTPPAHAIAATTAHTSAEGRAVGTLGSTVDQAYAVNGAEVRASGVESTAAGTGAGPAGSDPLVAPLLAAAAAAGVPAATGLPLTPAALRSLLPRHPAAPLRRAVYEHGVLPRLAAALEALAEVAALRRRAAAALGYGSYAEYGYAGGGLAAAGSDAVVELLQAVAAELRPAAEAEVELMQRVLAEERAAQPDGRGGAAATQPPLAAPCAADADGGAGVGAGGSSGDVGSGGCAGLVGAEAARRGGGWSSGSSGGGGGDEGSRSRADSGEGGLDAEPGLAAWDVDYAAALLQQRRGLTPGLVAQVQEYLSLEGVLAGLSELLTERMGVGLRLHAPHAHAPPPGAEPAHGRTAAQRATRTPPQAPTEAAPRAPAAAQAPAASGGAAPDAPPAAGCELWGPHVVALTVLADGAPAGTVYLEPGGGYGTRQLRFPAGPAAAAASAGSGGGSGGGGGGAGRGDALPVVAVGLNADWSSGVAGAPSALHELLHELGHALHLTLSSAPSPPPPPPPTPQPSSAPPPQPPPAAAPAHASAAAAPPPAAYGAFGGLGLPLELLEVPSSLLQSLAYEPAALSRICRRRRRGREQRGDCGHATHGGAIRESGGESGGEGGGESRGESGGEGGGEGGGESGGESGGERGGGSGSGSADGCSSSQNGATADGRGANISCGSWGGSGGSTDGGRAGGGVGVNSPICGGNGQGPSGSRDAASAQGEEATVATGVAAAAVAAAAAEGAGGQPAWGGVERRQGEEAESEADGEWEPLPAALASRLAAHTASEFCGPLTTLNKVLASLVEQVLHGQGPGGGGDLDAGEVWLAVRQAYGALPSCPATLRELASLSALAQHQNTFHSYTFGVLAASAMRLAHPPLPHPPLPPAPPASQPPQDLHVSPQPPPPLQPQPHPQPQTACGVDQQDLQQRQRPLLEQQAPQPVPSLAHVELSDTTPRPWEGIRRAVFEARAGEDPWVIYERMLTLRSCGGTRTAPGAGPEWAAGPWGYHLAPPASDTMALLARVARAAMGMGDE